MNSISNLGGSNSFDCNLSYPMLPSEMMFKILELVDINDLLRNCRLVCKQWNVIVSKIKIDELVLVPDLRLNKNYRWCLTGQLSKNKLEVTFSKNSILNSSLLNLEHLKHLKIDVWYVGIETLNKFKGLQTLDLNCFKIDSDDILNMPNLIVLQLDRLNRALKIDAPKLRVLKCMNNFKNIQLFQKETIKLIITNNFTNEITSFKKLQTLFVKCIHPVRKNILKQLTDLNELNIDPDFSTTTSRYNSTIKTIHNLLGEKKELRRDNLTIQFELNSILNADQLEEESSGDEYDDMQF